jgi:hypothetical protein
MSFADHIDPKEDFFSAAEDEYPLLLLATSTIMLVELYSCLCKGLIYRWISRELIRFMGRRKRSGVI